MKLGIQYYRPPNPDRVDWEIDYPNMKEAGLEVIRFWVPWRCVEPEQGTWVFDDYDRLFRLAEQHGLKVLVQLIPEAAPEWAIRAHPDKLYHNEHGPIHPFHATTVQVGGWPGLNFDYPETRAYFDAYTRAMAERYAGSEALYGWDVWNELQNGGVTHFDPANQRTYQEYLRLTYKTIAAYNQKYFTRYEDFSEIRLRPRDQQLQHEALEIHRFAAWRMTRELDHRIRAVKAVDSRHPVTFHYGNFASLLWNHSNARANIGVADMTGMSVYLESDSNHAYLTFCADHSYVAGKKPWGVFEHLSGRMAFDKGYYSHPPAHLLNRMAVAKMMNASLFMLWQYRPERFGQEAPNFGLVEADGIPNDRLREVSRFADFLKQHNQAMDSFRPAPAQVAVVVDANDNVLSSLSTKTWGADYIRKNDEIQGWMKAVACAGYAPTVIDVEDLIENGVPSTLRMLIMPGNGWVAHHGLAELLDTWVQNGGILWAGPFLGVYDDDCYASKQLPPGAYRDLFGVRIKDRICAKSFSLRGMRGRVATSRFELTGRQIHDVLVPGSDVEILAHSEHGPAITARLRGKGWALYFSSFFGTEYVDKAGDLPRFIEMCAPAMGLEPEYTPDGFVLVRQGACEGGHLIMIANLDYESPSAAKFECPHGGQMRELWTNGDPEPVQSGQMRRVPLAPADFRIFQITR